MSLIVELDDRTAAAVTELAANENRTASEVIRDAVAAYPGKRKGKLPRGVGKYSSAHTDTAQRVDEILSDAVKDGLWPLPPPWSAASIRRRQPSSSDAADSPGAYHA